MRKLRPLFILTFLCLFLSTVAHAAYLVEWAGDRFMLGPNDGLSQMMPFKAMLYEQYTSGEFFYSPFSVWAAALIVACPITFPLRFSSH